MPKKGDLIIKKVTKSGVIVEPIKPENYVTDAILGGTITPLTPPSVIFPDGHGHLKYQGKPEMQFNRKFDSYSCVIFTIAKAVCYNLKERYNIDITISEMFNAFFAGVIQGRGTTINNGMESFRKHGWVSDADYPFTAETTLRQFQAQPPIAIVNKATGELTKWKFNWEAIGKDHLTVSKNLQRTVAVGTGFAWASYYGEGVYFDYNNPPNHAFLIVDYKINDKGGINLIVDDSYPRDNRYDDDSTPDEFIKELDASFNLGSCHRCWLEPVIDTQETFIIKFKNMAMQFARDVRGGFHLLKDLKRQKITSWYGLLALLGEILKPRQISDEELNKFKDVSGTKEHFFPES